MLVTRVSGVSVQMTDVREQKSDDLSPRPEPVSKTAAHADLPSVICFLSSGHRHLKPIVRHQLTIQPYYLQPVH